MTNHMPKAGIKLAPLVGKRVAAYYRIEYPKHTDKHLARETGCALDTAKKWLQGQCPSNEHLFQMWARRGKEFFAFVFADVDEDLAAIASLQNEYEEIEKRIQGLTEAVEKHGNAFKRD